MGIRLTLWGWIHILALVVVMIGVAVVKVVTAGDHALNYTRVAAAVDSVEMRCRPTSGRRILRDAIAGDPDWKDGAWGDCDGAQRWVRRARVGYSVERSQIVYLRYISPADRQEHSGTLDVRRLGSTSVPAGGQIELYASDKDPARFDPA